MSKDKYIEWRKEWRTRSLKDGFVNTKISIPTDIHTKVSEQARQLGVRMPDILGQYVMSHIEYLEGKAPTPIDNIASRHPGAKSDISMLCKMISLSRFKGDTGAARYRQIAFVQLIADEINSGHRPTIRTMARTVNSTDSQIELLYKQLEVRGILGRTLVPGVAGAPSGKVIYIRNDAVEAFNAAHLEETGISSILSAPQNKTS